MDKAADKTEPRNEAADADEGSTSEKQRSRRGKALISHVATVYGSVYSDKKKAAKDKENPPFDGEYTEADIFEMHDSDGYFEADECCEPEGSEDDTPYEPCSEIRTRGPRTVECTDEISKPSDINRLCGIMICEERPLGRGRDYANRLTEVLSGSLDMLPPVRRGNDIWQTLFDKVPSVFIVSLSLPDVDPFGLIDTLRQSKLCCCARFFVCATRATKSVLGVCGDAKLDGVFTFSAPIEQTAAAIVGKCLDYVKNRAEIDIDALEHLLETSAFFSDVDEQKRRYAIITDSILLPLGLQKEHRGTEFLRLLVSMRLFGVDADLKRMYEYAAMYYHSTPAAVERAIRYSIERAWERGDLQMQFEFFGNTTDSAKGKPTNAEFIATVVQHVRSRFRQGSFVSGLSLRHGTDAP